MAPIIKHENWDEIGSVPSNDYRTDSISFELSSTLEKLPPLSQGYKSNFEVKAIHS